MYFIHNFGKLKTGFYKIIERYLAKHLTAIIAISNKQKHELSENISYCSQRKDLCGAFRF